MQQPLLALAQGACRIIKEYIDKDGGMWELTDPQEEDRLQLSEDALHVPALDAPLLTVVQVDGEEVTVEDIDGREFILIAGKSHYVNAALVLIAIRMQELSTQ